MAETLKDEVQDKEREEILCSTFGLDRTKDRMGVDAFSGDIEWELKGTTGTNYTTSRVVGKKWLLKMKPKHWLFGRFVFENGHQCLSEAYYGNPQSMSKWLDEKLKSVLKKENYINAVQRSLDGAKVCENIGTSPSAEAINQILSLSGCSPQLRNKVRKFTAKHDLVLNDPIKCGEAAGSIILEVLLEKWTENNPKISSKYVKTHFHRIDDLSPKGLLLVMESANKFD
jgi:hypothetical protein